MTFILRYFYNMLKIITPVILLLLTGCTGNPQTSALSVKKELSKELKEISGMSAQGKNIWTITDKPRPLLYNLDSAGNLVQTITIKSVQVLDVEAVTADTKYVYRGDIGDNNANREERQIVRVPVDSIGKNAYETVNGEM